MECPGQAVGLKVIDKKSNSHNRNFDKFIKFRDCSYLLNSIRGNCGDIVTV